ncbi:hypothetical protein DFS34DRAFT_612498 [Phlyctochytrium arcticum]|nr:hypothetical protein DFS34DRAFT_612498 [Phlyctochytrium arcticum]
MAALSPRTSDFQIINIGEDEGPGFGADGRKLSSELPLPATASGRLQSPYHVMPGGLNAGGAISPSTVTTTTSARTCALSPTSPPQVGSDFSSSPGGWSSLGRRKRHSSSHVPTVSVPPPANVQHHGALSPLSLSHTSLSPTQQRLSQNPSYRVPSAAPSNLSSASPIPAGAMNIGRLQINTHLQSGWQTPSSPADHHPTSPSPASNSNVHQLERKRQLYMYRQSRVPYDLEGVKVDLQGDRDRERGFSRVRNWTEQRPQQSNRIPNSVLNQVTSRLLETYIHINPTFHYESNHNPRRVLTKPSKPAHNHGRDNEEWDYLLYVNDIMGSQEGRQYRIQDVLGQGTFGQVAKCINIKTQEAVAVKVIKNKPAYHNQSLMEVAILEMLNLTFDPNDTHKIVRMKDHFIHHNHLCIVFEMLSVNLYELIKQNQFRGLSTNLVRIFVRQILDALVVLSKARIIHCDLKPENILLRNLESPNIKVIDYGSACHENQTVYTYIQSRFYRSPEVLLGLPYTSSIDMWSLGCIAGELFLGLPLFPGSSEYNQISRIVEILGPPPTYMCEKGKSAKTFFNKEKTADNKTVYTLKKTDQYMKETGHTEQASKRYFVGNTLAEIVLQYPASKKELSAEDAEREAHNRRCFIDFLAGLLNMNPFERWTPQQAKLHPFITGERFTGSYIPPGARTTAPQPSVNTAPPPTSPEYREPTKRRPRANTISSLQETLPPQLQRLAAINQQNHGMIRSTPSEPQKSTTTNIPGQVQRGENGPDSSGDHGINDAVNSILVETENVPMSASTSPCESEVSHPRSKSASDGQYVSARQSLVASPSTRSFATNLTTMGENSSSVGSSRNESHSRAGTACSLEVPPYTSPTTPDRAYDIEAPVIDISVHSGPTSGDFSPLPAMDVNSSPTRPEELTASSRSNLPHDRYLSIMADPVVQGAFQYVNDDSTYDHRVSHRDPASKYTNVEDDHQQRGSPYEDSSAFHGGEHRNLDYPPAEQNAPYADSVAARNYSSNLAAFASLRAGYPLRKARSQMLDTLTVDGHSSSSQASANPHYFPLGLLSRNDHISQSHGSFAERSTVSLAEGHPRHGQTGERSALPSRRPSIYSSLDWDPFGDLERGMPSKDASARSSRRGSTDVRQHADPRYFAAVNAAHLARVLASEEAQRHPDFNGKTHRRGSEHLKFPSEGHSMHGSTHSLGPVDYSVSRRGSKGPTTLDPLLRKGKGREGT